LGLLDTLFNPQANHHPHLSMAHFQRTVLALGLVASAAIALPAPTPLPTPAPSLADAAKIRVMILLPLYYCHGSRILLLQHCHQWYPSLPENINKSPQKLGQTYPILAGVIGAGYRCAADNISITGLLGLGGRNSYTTINGQEFPVFDYTFAKANTEHITLPNLATVSRTGNVTGRCKCN
jgi:hypothetical protein